MADLGTIGQDRYKLHDQRFLPNWRNVPVPSEWEKIDLLGIIDGLVTILGAPQYNNDVFLYYRSNGHLVEKVKTDISGNFVIGNLDRFDSEAYLLSVSSNDAASYNAIVYDRLTAR